MTNREALEILVCIATHKSSDCVYCGKGCDIAEAVLKVGDFIDIVDEGKKDETK